MLDQLDRGEIDALYMLNGDPEGWISESDTGKLDKLKLLIVQDLLGSTANSMAHFVLPGAAWAEKEGTFINHNGLAQAIHRGLRGPEGSRPDGRILMELLGRSGLFHAATLRQEIGNELAALSAGELGEKGLFLTSPKTEPQPVG